MIFHLIQIFGAETSQNLRGEIIWLMSILCLFKILNPNANEKCNPLLSHKLPFTKINFLVKILHEHSSLLTMVWSIKSVLPDANQQIYYLIIPKNFNNPEWILI